METEPKKSDEHYARLAQCGDEKAFGVLFTRHHILVKSVIQRVCWFADIDEIAQEVFLEAFRKIGDYDSEQGNFKAWIITISKRRTIDHQRSDMSRQNAYDRFEQAISQDSQTVDIEDHSYATKWKDLLPLIREAMSELPPLQALAYRLVLDGKSQRQIASILNLPLGTVKTRIEYAERGITRILLIRFKLKKANGS